ncbi:hypothetical protein HYV11_00815 [Candidatus Dependentiae bacterium]|nr:hypothetical protein [Candidatus Dependentiae bacterium]
MKKIIFFYFICAFNTLCLFSEEFLYPIVAVDEKRALVLHQKSLDDIDLFIWNQETKIATKELCSFFLPSQIQLLPSKHGFSFFDRGILRIKMFQKRTPKTINLAEYTSSTASIVWLNDQQFYGIGKYKKNYHLFLYDLENTEKPFAWLYCDSSFDFLYPYKIGELFFCIIKDQSKQVYSIVQFSWQLIENTIIKDQEGSKIFLKESNAIYSCLEPLCFLHMTSTTEGYFLKNSYESETFVAFTCMRIKEALNHEWLKQELFSFKLPKHFLVGESPQRVFESIKPFLPNYDHEQFIFFVSFEDSNQKTIISSFNKENGEISQLTMSSSSGHSPISLLAPIFIQNTAFYGVILQNKRNSNSVLEQLEDTGTILIDFPRTRLYGK